jgi:hypothetical protein
MSSDVIAAIIAFGAGVIVAVLGGWFTQRTERQKRLAQLASTAFVDAAAAISENVQCNDVRNAPPNRFSADEKAHWERRAFKTASKYYSAKARIAAYGNSKVNKLLAEIERQGGITGDDEEIRQMAAELVLSFRKDLGFKKKKKEPSEEDVATLLFGPKEGDRKGEFIGWPRTPLRPNDGLPPPETVS